VPPTREPLCVVCRSPRTVARVRGSRPSRS
jgi:hypothetical protein